MIDAAVGSIHSLTVDQEIDFDNLEMVKKSDHKMNDYFKATQFRKTDDLFYVITFTFDLPVILEPNFHLIRRQFDLTGQNFSFGCRQIPLLPKSPLQFERLRFRKQYSTFP
uniref:Uncharacterized protein n=1 Tax=Romanomermis culicivorax TaxID=13658 RepID=A0A915J6I2_ROMCU